MKWSLLLLLALAGLASPSPSCEGLLYSGQCHQEVYTEACQGRGQRLFQSQGRAEGFCDCDVAEGWIKYRGVCHQHLAPSPHCEGNTILQIVNSRSRYWRCIPNPCGADLSSLPHKSDWNSTRQGPCHQVDPLLPPHYQEPHPPLSQCELQLLDDTLVCCTSETRTTCTEESRGFSSARPSCGARRVWTNYLKKCIRLFGTPRTRSKRSSSSSSIPSVQAFGGKCGVLVLGNVFNCLDQDEKQ